MCRSVRVFLGWWEQDLGSSEAVSEPSLRRFIRLLGMDELRDSIDATRAWLERKPWVAEDWPKIWRYFCGVAWNKVKRLGVTDEATTGDGI